MERIEFIIPTYDRPHHLMCLLNSLMAQTNPNWTAHVVADNPPASTLRYIQINFSYEYRIRFSCLPTRYNDWGHTPRNYGLNLASETWVCMTGEDNYYVPTFVDEVLRQAEAGVNYIYCDMVHNWTAGQYSAVSCAPVTGRIDIGNSVYRTQYAKQMKLDVKDKMADGKFCEEYNRRFPGQIRHICKYLYVHN